MSRAGLIEDGLTELARVLRKNTHLTRELVSFSIKNLLKISKYVGLGYFKASLTITGIVT